MSDEIKLHEQERMYRPREIADNGWIKNSRGKNDYFFVMKLIKTGRLKSVKIGAGSREYNMVSAAEIQRYQDSLSKGA